MSRTIWWMSVVGIGFLIESLLFARPVTIVDLEKRSIKLDATPKRIICLGPGALRLITYLQATKAVVGVEAMEKLSSKGRPYWLANPSLHHLPAISPGGPAGINKMPDIEKILTVKPDLIFITMLDKVKADELQRKTNTPVIVLSYGKIASFDETIFVSLELAGKVLAKEARTSELIQYIKRAEIDVARRMRNIKNRHSIYISGIGYKGGQGFESSNASYHPITWLGGGNVAQESGHEGHVFLNKERILKMQPEVIYIDGGGLELIEREYQRQKIYYQKLKAFINQRVYTLFPFNMYTTNLDTMVLNAYVIGKTAYPNAFHDVNIKDKAAEIYQVFVGRDVFEIMEKDYGTVGAVPFTLLK